MAHTKSSGTSKLGRDSESKRLGVKLSDGQFADAGKIIIRQRGSHYVAGDKVRKGSDDTLYAVGSGAVKYLSKRKRSFDGRTKIIKVVSVV